LSENGHKSIVAVDCYCEINLARGGRGQKQSFLLALVYVSVFMQPAGSGGGARLALATYLWRRVRGMRSLFLPRNAAALPQGVVY
jgi:hypothetical protein